MAPPSRSFEAFGTSHLAALAVTVAIVALMGWAARTGQSRALRILEITLGWILLSMPMVTATAVAMTGPFDLQSGLPLHYCDMATIAGGIALLFRRPLAIEIVYFFGLAGTLQGLLTPALQLDFPHPRYFHFFVIHGGVVIAALHLVWNRGFHPRPWAIARMLVATVVYSTLAGVLNWLLHTNFGFLCAKPPNASLMDHLGPWPWYVGSLLALSAVFYTVLDLPFWKERSLAWNTSHKV